MTNRMRRLPILIAALLLVPACGTESLSTAEAQNAAKERVRQSLELTEESALFTNTFIGEPVNGQTILCGTVEGRRADGTAITPHRFIAAVEPEQWLTFQPVDGNILPSRPDKFVEWHTTCAGEAEA